MACMAAWAQEKVLRIPYSSDKSIYGIISYPTSTAHNSKPGIAIICHGFNPQERVLSNQYVKEFLDGQK